MGIVITTTIMAKLPVSIHCERCHKTTNRQWWSKASVIPSHYMPRPSPWATLTPRRRRSPGLKRHLAMPPPKAGKRRYPMPAHSAAGIRAIWYVPCAGGSTDDWWFWAGACWVSGLLGRLRNWTAENALAEAGSILEELQDLPIEVGFLDRLQKTTWDGNTGCSQSPSGRIMHVARSNGRQ